MKQLSRFFEIYRMGGLSPALISLVDLDSAQRIAYLRSLLKDRQQQNLSQLPLGQLPAVVFDLETTGFHPQSGHAIISIGAVALQDCAIVPDETFYSLVNPKRAIPSPVQSLTAITDEMAREAPDLADVLIRFFRFVRQRTLIAHGSGHDKRFLNTALRKVSGAAMMHRLLDTMMIGCKLYPGQVSFTLDDWLRFYGLEQAGRHHALQDSVMTARLWIALVDDLKNRDIQTLGDLYEFLGRDHSTYLKEMI
jgi:DNA polymerase-3 subunit epsilon